MTISSVSYNRKLRSKPSLIWVITVSLPDTSGQLIISTTLELGLGIIVGSTVTLRPLFRSLLGDGSTLGTSTRDRNRAGNTLTSDHNGGRSWEPYTNKGARRLEGQFEETELSKIKVEGGATSKFSKTYGRSKKNSFPNDSEEELTADLSGSMEGKEGILKITSVNLSEEHVGVDKSP